MGASWKPHGPQLLRPLFVNTGSSQHSLGRSVGRNFMVQVRNESEAEQRPHERGRVCRREQRQRTVLTGGAVPTADNVGTLTARPEADPPEPEQGRK